MIINSDGEREGVEYVWTVMSNHQWLRRLHIFTFQGDQIVGMMEMVARCYSVELPMTSRNLHDRTRTVWLIELCGCRTAELGNSL